MGKLIYLMNVSLDGYVETADHSLDWATVDEELHRWFTEQERAADASLYGRRMYEVMSAYWPTGEADEDAPEFMHDYARVWNAKPHLVFSRSLTDVHPSCELVGDPGDVGDALARIRERFDGNLSVSGPNLAAAFIERGLVDEYQLVVHPVILGAGTPFFPRLEQAIRLRLLDTHTFSSGVTAITYAAR